MTTSDLIRPKVAIFTPTQRPGFDVTWHSIRRQDCDADILWIVCDELLGKRRQVFESMTAPDREKYKTNVFWLPKKPGYKRNLARAYNTAMDIARDWEAHMFISLQDYIYVPEDGVSKFMQMYQDIQLNLDAPAIYTGITSISADPGVETVHDREAMFSIFKESYDKRPEMIEWMDCRFKADHPAQYQVVPAVEFETNWACIPHEALYDEKLYFDEEYDKAVAYENQDYAFKAKSLNYEVLIDYDNQVISLPHKKYFAEEWAEEEPLTQTNRELCEGKWNA